MNQAQILLIDDEAVVREIGSEMLTELGYRCIAAESGEQGIRRYQDNRRDIALVILDIEMPGISGDQVYQQLKDQCPTLKILLTSGYSRSYLEAQYFKRKLDPAIFMPKPFQLAQLGTRVKKILET